MIRVVRADLPGGLEALARCDQHGDLTIYISASLTPPEQRSAVSVAVKAFGLRRTRARRVFPRVQAAVRHGQGDAAGPAAAGDQAPR